MPAVPLTNIYGQYWSTIGKVIMGLNDIRARAGTMTNPWSAESDKLFVPPELITINDSLSDLLDQRAIELNALAKTVNKTICILWSGGIDSTSVVTAFIKNVDPKDFENITIYLTTSSIVENFNFYQKFIYPNFKCVSFHDIDVNEAFLDNNILLHGDPGDCVYGPSVLMYEHLLHGMRHLEPWKNNLPEIIIGIDKFSTIPGFGAWYANKITNNLLEVSPPGVDTVADWWWWNYYNFKWGFSLWRPFFKMRKNLLEPLSSKNIEFYVKNSFLNTDKFQQWSYSNLKTHVGKSRQDHKMQVKQYIFELDSNPQYLYTKTKVDSSPKNWNKKIRPVYYDQNWVAHYASDPGVGETAIELLENFKG